MTRAPGPEAVACASCGAGISVLGGGRVVARVCEYCGAALDANEGWRVLARYERTERPASPLRLGMTGEIAGDRFTVIGTLGRQETWQGRTWRWAEHQVHSPLRGYAWLSVEDGHAVFTRRHRGGTIPRWIGAWGVERAESRPSARLRGDPRRFVYHETSIAVTDFVEGAFTWLPHPGETSTTVTLVRGDEALGFTEGETERETTLSRYLPQAATWAAFGVEPPPRRGVHALQPHEPWRHAGFVMRAAGLFAVAALLATFWFWAEPGRAVLGGTELAVADLPAVVPFEVADTGRLARVAVAADMENAWAAFGLLVEGPGGEPVLAAAPTVEMYSGRDADGAWREGDGRAAALFRPAAPGPHTLTVTLVEAELWNEARVAEPPSRVRVEVRSGLGTALWTGLASLLFAATALAAAAPRLLHAHAQRRLSDWSDD